MVETKKGIFFVFIVLSFVLNSCQKYEEGPKISLRSRKSRLVNDWKESETFVINEGGDKSTVDSYNFYLHIKKDNTYESDYYGSGTWELIDGNKLKIKNNPPNSAILRTPDLILIEEEFEIVRLKEKELWIRAGNSRNIRNEIITIEFHLN